MEYGARLTLSTMRYELHKAVGAKVKVVTYEGWLEESIKKIHVYGSNIFFRDLLSELRPKTTKLELVTSQVHFQDVTQVLLQNLSKNPNDLLNLLPDLFEQLICEHLDKMGFGVERVGNNAYSKDGGIDIIAWPLKSTLPYLIAVQAKHHKSQKSKTGRKDVADLSGVISNHNFNLGVLVTNTTFTPDANFFAQKQPLQLRLRDFNDISRWLRDDFLDDLEWREMPNQIEVSPGLIIPISKS